MSHLAFLSVLDIIYFWKCHAVNESNSHKISTEGDTMNIQGKIGVLCFICAIWISILFFPVEARGEVVNEHTYADLVSLFKDFREFQKPKMTDGLPDYTASVMKEQKEGLKKFQARLEAIDPSGWPVSQQVDYHLVRAEMNGLEFHHRVLRPWSRNPDFYTPKDFAHRAIPDPPLGKEELAELHEKLKTVPMFLKQAQTNLVEGSGELAILAVQSLKFAHAFLKDLEPKLVEHHPGLASDVRATQTAIEEYRDWLQQNKEKMKSPSGVGIENYNWWLKNVWLFPYTWEECRRILEREYGRSIAHLKLMENRNRNLPEAMLATTQEGYALRYLEAEEELLKFLHEESFFTVPDFFKGTGPDVVAPAWNGPERQSGIREFFENCSDRDPMQQIIHNFAGHYYDMLLLERDDRPIRGARRLFNIDNVRAEGPATGLEEALMVAGLYENRPRGKEIVYIASAYRSIRGLADLRMHSNEFSFEEAVDFDVKMCPYGWAIKDGYTIWAHKSNTPLVPGFEMSYTMGKVQLEKLIADRAYQLGEKFDMRQFMDELRSYGMVPFALIRWEMTGLDDEIKKLW